MGIIESVAKSENINIILGDYFARKIGVLSRTELARVFFIEFSGNKKIYIEDINSLSNITQTYLDLALGTRTTLVNKVKDVYDFFNNPNVGEVQFDEFLISEKVSSIISFDYSVYFEKRYSEILKKVTKDDLEKEKGKINFYKIFGDLNTPENMLITDQDIRKFKILEGYKPYFKALREEFYQRKTVILGDDIKNNDILEMLDYIFSTCDISRLKTLYFYSQDKNISPEYEEFIEKYNIKILDLAKESEESIEKNGVEIEKEETNQLTIPEILGDTPSSEIDCDEPEICCSENVSAILMRDGETHEEIRSVVISDEVETIEILNEIETTKEIGREIIGDSAPVIREIVYLETAAQLRLNALSLKSNPVRYSNIYFNQDEVGIKKINTTNFILGNTTITGAKLRILEFPGIKLLEVKTREFRIKVSVAVLKNGDIVSDGDIYEYEIFDGINHGRFPQVLSLLSDLFNRKTIIFKDNFYHGKLEISNEKERFKMNLINEFLKNFESLDQVKGKKFSSITEDYYKLYLLYNYEKSPEYETWGNFTLTNQNGELVKTPLEYVRDHEIRIKGLERFTLREKITITDEIKEAQNINQYSIFKQKKMKITLEGIKGE